MKKKLTSILLIFALMLALAPLIGTDAAAANPPSITASSAAVIDVATGEVLFERDAYRLRPPASMTKNVTAFIVYEEIAAGRLSFDTMITVSQNAVNISRANEWRAGTIFTTVGAQYSVETMLRLIMLISHNGACVAVAEHISGSEGQFAVRMNEEMQRLGIEANFQNSHGLWGNSISAVGMARFLRHFIIEHPDFLRITAMQSSPFRATTIPNTNHLLSHAHVDGIKTGTTGAAGPCLSSTAFRGEHRVVAVTMNSSNRDTRFSDSLRLLNFGLDEAARRADERRAAEEASRVDVRIDGVLIEFDTPARLIADRTMVPIRVVAETLGATVEWIAATESVKIISASGDVIYTSIGSYTLYINNEATRMDIAPVIRDARTLFPVRFIGEALGAVVNWDGENRTVVITSR